MMKGRTVERDKALEMAIAQIEKQHGKGAVMKMSDKGEMSIETVPTGALALDVALGVGGLPRGRVVEIFGPESSGKTTLMLHAIAEAQKAGGVCAFIDAEHAFDMNYARRLGVRLAELLVSQPDCGEQALEIRRTGQIEVGDALVGNHASVKVVKNKVAPPFKEAEFDILFGQGVNRVGEIIDLGTAHNLIEKSGAWYGLDGERVAQGRDRM